MIRKRTKLFMVPQSGMFTVLHRVIVNFPGMMSSSIFLSVIFLSWLLFNPALNCQVTLFAFWVNGYIFNTFNQERCLCDLTKCWP